jgi:hypothetical protein
LANGDFIECNALGWRCNPLIQGCCRRGSTRGG